MTFCFCIALRKMPGHKMDKTDFFVDAYFNVSFTAVMDTGLVPDRSQRRRVVENKTKLPC